MPRPPVISALCAIGKSISVMATIRLTKIDAARRQISAGIRMLFVGKDPVAIHTLAMAAFRTVRDLTARQGDSYMHEITKVIKNGVAKPTI